MSTRWIAYTKQRTCPRLRLFCLPYAGGSAAIFRTWSDLLPLAIEVCPIEVPGRGARLTEPPFTSLPPLVEATAAALLPYLDMPFAFYGHSMGALVAFELARLLGRRHNLIPAHLFVAAHSAPQLCAPRQPTPALSGAELKEKLRRLDGTPREVLEHPELMELVGPMLRADFALCDAYTYVRDAPLTCPISAFGGLQDPLVSCDGIAAWRDQTTATFSMRMLPGGHFFLQGAPSPVPRLIPWELCQAGGTGAAYGAPHGAARLRAHAL